MPSLVVVYFGTYMKVIIPMSGTGERFKKAGYSKLKPLISVDGLPMVEHVVGLFSPDDEFIFICSTEHLGDEKLGLEAYLKNLRPKTKVIGIEKHRRGPNHAILAASALLDDKPVFVSYCDYNLKWNRESFLEKIKEVAPHSASICYIGFHPHLLRPYLYAGVRADENGLAKEVREKHSFTENKMDTWQQAGLFYFSSGEVLKRYCERAFKENWVLNDGESYTSLLFTPMIEDGLISLVYPAEYFCQWGTPEDLEEYEAWSRFFANENGRGKGVTDIPAEREENVRIRHSPDSEEYKKTHAYWKGYFSK